MWAWAVVFTAIFLIGLTKSGFGAGVGLMIAPMSLLAMGHTRYGSGATLGVLLPLLLAGDVIAVWQYRRLFSFPVVRRLLPGTALGVLAGALVLHWFDSHSQRVTTGLIEVEVGLESTVLVLLHWWRNWRGDVPSLAHPRPWQSGAVGGLAGLSSTLAHAAGPVIALYLLPQKLDRRVFVGTCAVYFFLVNAAKLPAYRLSGQLSAGPLLLSARLLPLVVAGALAGVWLNRRINDTAFSRFIYIATFLLGWYLLYLGVATLRGA